MIEEECLGCGRSSCICCEYCGNAPCLCDQEYEEPFTDGPLKGKIVKVDGFRGVACLVVSDDGKNLCTVSAFEKEVADITVNLLRDAGWEVSDSYKENPKPGFPGRFVWTFAVGKPQ